MLVNNGINFWQWIPCIENALLVTQENARETREKVKLLLQLADTLVEKVNIFFLSNKRNFSE
jgi:hypothetical protein